VKSQTEEIYSKLVAVRPFSLTANDLYWAFDEDIPKVSVNRALNELQKRGLVLKKDNLVQGTAGRRVRPWRATYKEKI
jgi:predicted transcriptional regulator